MTSRDHLLYQNSPLAVCGATPRSRWHGRWDRASCKRCDSTLKGWQFWGHATFILHEIEKPQWIGMGVEPDPLNERSA